MGHEEDYSRPPAGKLPCSLSLFICTCASSTFTFFHLYKSKFHSLAFGIFFASCTFTFFNFVAQYDYFTLTFFTVLYCLSIFNLPLSLSFLSKSHRISFYMYLPLPLSYFFWDFTQLQNKNQFTFTASKHSV